MFPRTAAHWPLVGIVLQSRNIQDPLCQYSSDITESFYPSSDGHSERLQRDYPTRIAVKRLGKWGCCFRSYFLININLKSMLHKCQFCVHFSFLWSSAMSTSQILRQLSGSNSPCLPLCPSELIGLAAGRNDPACPIPQKAFWLEQKWQLQPATEKTVATASNSTLPKP